MAPIRVGLIGLSQKALTSWASTAHLPYLLASSDKYAITALCNSTVQAAQSAIKAYCLPSTTRAYGNPQDLANDKEVDLVVCCTRVDVHHGSVRPSIEMGKDVYVEWPLTSNLEEAIELNSLAKISGSKTIIGLQGRYSPVVLRAKSLIEQGRIGKILGVSVTAYDGTINRNPLSSGLKYFTQKSIGGNIITIGFGHMIDYFMSVLGEFSSFTIHTEIKQPHIPIANTEGHITEIATSDVPDFLHLDGSLQSGAPFSVKFQWGKPPDSSSGLQWHISGERGEIEITASGPSLQAHVAEVTIRVHDFATDMVEEVPWGWSNEDLPLQARNVAIVYEMFAQKRKGHYPDFEDAVTLHRLLEEILEREARNENALEDSKA